MKCKVCGGTGVIQGQAPGLVSCCPACEGKGFIELTNEEWLRSATFEELAGAIYEWYTLGYTRGKNGVKLNSITEVVEWLKQPHRGDGE